MRTKVKLFRRRMRRLGVSVTWKQAHAHIVWSEASDKTVARGRQLRLTNAQRKALS